MKHLVCTLPPWTPNAEVVRAAKRIGLNALLDIIAEHLGDLAMK